MNRPLQSSLIASSAGLRPALLVAGMHRSGTSALARVMSLLGAGLPKTLMAPGPDNPRGFWESPIVAELNDSMLAAAGSSWDDPLALLARRAQLAQRADFLDRIVAIVAEEFEPHGPIVIKDPRVALLLDAWVTALPRAGFAPLVVVPLRDPLEVAQSLAARQGFSIGRSLLLWLSYSLAAERSSRGIARTFVGYGDLLSDWRAVFQRVEGSLAFSFPKWNPSVELEVDAFVSIADRHQRLDPSQLGTRDDVAGWVKRAYAILGAAAAPRGDLDQARLDAVGAEFEEQLRVFAPVIAEQGAAATAARRSDEDTRRALQQAECLAQDLSRQVAAADLLRQAAVDETERLRLALSEANANSDADARQLRAQIALREDQVRERSSLILTLGAGASRRDAQIAELEQDLRAKDSQLHSLEADIRDRDVEIFALRGDVEVREESLAALAEDVHALEARLGEAVAALDQQSRDAQRQALVQADLGQGLAQRDAMIASIAATLRLFEARVGELSAALSEGHDERAALEAGLRRVEQGLIDAQEQLRGRTHHVEALEASMRVVQETARIEQEAHTRFEAYAGSLSRFIAEHRAWAWRARAFLWRAPPTRPLSDLLEFSLLALRAGPVVAAKTLRICQVIRSAKLFDHDFYLASAWDVAATGQDPIVHYVVAGAKEARDPSPTFSTPGYCARYADVARAGINPLFHFIRHGSKEGRVAAEPPPQAPRGESAPPTAVPAMKSSLSPLRLADPYTIRPDDCVAAEAAKGVAFVKRFGLLGEMPDWAGAVAALNGHDGQLGAAPDVSIIVPVYGELAYTLNCLHALLDHKTRLRFEVVVVDDCSRDDTALWISRVRGVRLVSLPRNGGFIVACNAGASEARGTWLVFLNNDTRVVEGWLDALIDSFTALPNAELVGSKLFYPDGSLQEAGGILWRDGSAWNFGRNDDPGKPEYCYARPVDYVSGASIAISRRVWDEIGGFDKMYHPAYGEDSDLCLKIRYQRGAQVWLQPLSRVVHYEGKTSGVDTLSGPKAHQIENAKKLYKRWRDALQVHRTNADRPDWEKDRGVAKRALVIDAVTPEPDKDAGSVTCVGLIEAMQSCGYKVTFAAEDNLLYLPGPSAALQRKGVEVVYAPYLPSVAQLVRDRGGEFDVVLVFRVGVASRLLPELRACCPKARIVFHSSDLHFLREERRARLQGDNAAADGLGEQRRQEIGVISSVDLTIVHSTFERDVLAEIAPAAKTYVFPWVLDAVGRGAVPFVARSGVAFLGGFRHAPNVDAVLYFSEKIWPLVRAARPELKFVVAGSECPPAITTLHGSNNIEVEGFVADLTDLFAGIRLSVAPIRYGAGIKGKVAMSLAYGVPAVVTSCAAEGMGLSSGEAVIIEDDEIAFADAIVKLYDDEHRWRAMSDRGLAFVEDTYGSGLAKRRMQELLGLAGERFGAE